MFFFNKREVKLYKNVLNMHFLYINDSYMSIMYQIYNLYNFRTG
ncbi:hypothetical protein HMPREF3211_01908 [Staphylococcus aureus]|nr:hypothetical protein HMPREF3211_01908 [Staphylococcus aureus]